MRLLGKLGRKAGGEAEEAGGAAGARAVPPSPPMPPWPPTPSESDDADDGGSKARAGPGPSSAARAAHVGSLRWNAGAEAASPAYRHLPTPLPPRAPAGGASGGDGAETPGADAGQPQARAPGAAPRLAG